MTYAESFLADRYAQIAATIGHAYRKDSEWMHKTAFDLHRKNAVRLQEKGKEMSADHLKQEAVRLAK
jgi:hypothetical protein